MIRRWIGAQFQPLPALIPSGSAVTGTCRAAAIVSIRKHHRAEVKNFFYFFLRFFLGLISEENVKEGRPSIALTRFPKTIILEVVLTVHLSVLFDSRLFWGGKS